MAARGTSKGRSVKQEDHIALVYNGRRSPSSGAADTDAGDVRTSTHLIECKEKGEPGKHVTGYRIKLTGKDGFDKIFDEAVAEGRVPAMAIRLFAPGFPFTDREGYVDLMVRLVTDDYPMVYDSEQVPEYE